MTPEPLTDYERGYREGHHAAIGHYPDCPMIGRHMMGAQVCGLCRGDLGIKPVPPGQLYTHTVHR